MATWHQSKSRAKLWHATEWTVIIDPPNEFRALVTFTSRDLADVYMRNLTANNPDAARHSYILAPHA